MRIRDPRRRFAAACGALALAFPAVSRPQEAPAVPLAPLAPAGGPAKQGAAAPTGAIVATAALTLAPERARGDFYKDNLLGFMPATIALSKERPASVKALPAVGDDARFGKVTFGNAADATTLLVLDDAAKRLWIDANQDGDFTNDPDVKWTKSDEVDVDESGRKGTMLQAELAFPASWDLGGGATRRGTWWALVYHLAGGERAFSCSLSAMTGELEIAGKKHAVALLDSGGPTGGRALFGGPGAGGAPTQPPMVLLDVDGDGTFRSEGHEELWTAGGRRSLDLRGKWIDFEILDYGGQLVVREGREPPPQKARRALLKAGTPAPDFEMALPGGGKSRLSERRGKVVYVDFWATWCGPCLKAMPTLQALREKTKERADFDVIALCVGDERAKFDDWIAKNGAKYAFTFGYDPAGRAEDGTSQLEKWGISGIPTAAVIDAEGRIAEIVSGYTPQNLARLHEALKKLGIE